MSELDGKTSVVTGGSGGIGLATALQLAEKGSHVFVIGRREAGVGAAVETIGADRATGVVGDVSDPQDLDRLYDSATSLATSSGVGEHRQVSGREPRRLFGARSVVRAAVPVSSRY